MTVDVGALVDDVHAVLLAEAESEVVEADVARLVARRAPLLPADRRAEVVHRVRARQLGLGPIEEVLADPLVSEVMINGPGAVWIERGGRIESHSLALSEPEIHHLIERLVTPLGRHVDRRSPCLDGRLADGSRVNVVVAPAALDGPYVTIRRFVLRDVALLAFAEGDALAALEAAVDDGANIIVSGGTGAGKTTLLNALATRLPAAARIVTVEDAAELRLPHPHVVRLEGRPATVEGLGAISIRDLVRNALRMRPDRIVVGEVRGAEALDLVQALNTGHRGCLSTVHANGPADALDRLETLSLMANSGLPAEAIRRQLATAIDVVVQVARQPDGERRVTEVVGVHPDGSVESLVTP